MSRKKNWFKLKDNIYNTDVYFIYSGKKECKKFMLGKFKAYEKEGDLWCASTYYLESNDGCSSIVIRVDPTNNIAFYTAVSHEVAHAINYLYGRFGVIYGDNNDEHFCYMLDNMIGQIITFVNDKGLRKCK